MNVPFVDLKTQYQTIKDDIDMAIAAVIGDTAFVSGKYARAFEADFASYIGVHHCVGVGNGTDALFMAMHGFGLGSGDEVITAANTFIATAEGITWSGATPVFVDCEENSFNIDPTLIEAAITEKTRAILPVHLYGQPAEMDPILELAQQHDLLVIEDAAQAHGAVYRGRKAGSMGHCGCFSFYPGKNLGAYGDAGGVVTEDARLAERIRALGDHGSLVKYQHGASAPSAITAAWSSTSTIFPASTVASTASRPRCCRSSCAIWTPGPTDASPSRPVTMSVSPMFAGCRSPCRSGATSSIST